MSTSSRNILLGFTLFAGGLLLGWLASHIFSTARDVPTIAIYDDWRLACPSAAQKKLSCVLDQNVIDNKTRARVANLRLVQGDKGSVLVVTAPYNVLLRPGLGLAFGDAKPRIYPFITCNGEGCVVQIPVDDALRASLRQEPQARLLFANMNKQTVQVSFSLRGFKRADDVARRFESKLWWLGA